MSDQCTPVQCRVKDGQRREARRLSFPAGASLQGFARGLTGGITACRSITPPFRPAG